MPTQSHRINVTSPLVQYLDGQWSVPVSSSPDQSPSVSCHGNQNNDAKCSASLQFIGKNITLSLVDIHCDGDDNNNNCSTIFDDGSPQTASPDNIHELGIGEGPHNFNLIAKNIDLGYFNLASTVGSTNDLPVTNDSPAFAYEPQDAWHTNIISLPGFNGGNVSTTNQPNASVTFSFKGDRVALYGAVSAQGGNYTAQLDNRLALNLTEKIAFSPLPPNTFLPELIFFAAGLDVGDHNVTLVSTSPEVFTVDYAVVDADMDPNLLSASSSSTMSPGTSSTTVLPNTTGAPPSSAYSTLFFSSNSSRHPNGLSGARLIGLIAGVAILVALLLIALGYICPSPSGQVGTPAPSTPHSFNDFPPPHPTGVIPAPTAKHTQTSQQSLSLVAQPQRTSWDARSFDSRSSATLDESSEGYQAEVHCVLQVEI
ncbi:hypothetical protein DFH08DRAFT_818018 [Mycena albidolilacea]|uniref:Uncharacterized protein n=1 Tax=Mycena albidolilacea TaxID=1033008 RepID=A0AAD7EGZ4_9AGAR|nr:hypothetical protein DFH08DRAFT_818018 [Mycena albidolilacea]